MHSEGYSSRVCVCVCVCACVRACVRVSVVKSHLTFGIYVRLKNAVTYSAGNEGQNICGVFSETTPLQRFSTPSIVQSAIFPAESRHVQFARSVHHGGLFWKDE